MASSPAPEQPALKSGYRCVHLNNTSWEVPERYQDLMPIGAGAFGTVCSAFDVETSERVALKKLARPFQSDTHAKRCYRELKLLKHFQHDNVLGLLDVFTPFESLEQFQDVYLVTELMGSDLYKIVRTQDLSDDHVKFFIYQILRGLKYIHSAGIVHRDMKPSNIGVSEDCELKILDFGLGRAAADTMTGYVTTRYWRAPEVMLNWMHYDQKADVWSVGCIMAELLTGQVLFPGYDYKDHLKRILEICGSPDDEFMAKIQTESARLYVSSLPHHEKKDFSTFFLGANPTAIDLLNQLLCMDPDRRPTAAQALQHSYLERYHCPEDEPECSEKYDDSFEASSDIDVRGWKRLVFEEISSFVPPSIPPSREESMEA